MNAPEFAPLSNNFALSSFFGYLGSKNVVTPRWQLWWPNEYDGNGRLF